MGDNMVDLKLSKAELKKRNAPCGEIASDSSDKVRYPYGFSMTFNKREVEMLPALKAAAAGEEILIMAKAKVTEIHTNEKEGDKSTKRVEVQLQKIAVKAEPKKEFAAGFSTS